MQLSLSDIVALVSLAASLTALAKVFFSVAQSLAAIQVKVDTMWEFSLRRGKVEAVVQGFATSNSPIVFTARATMMIAPLASDLRQIYAQLEPITDAELAAEIERRLGARLLSEVCMPHRMYMGACLVLSVAAAKGELPNGLADE